MSAVKKSKAVKPEAAKFKVAKHKSAVERMPAKVALPPANRAMIEQSLSVGMGRSLHLHLKRLTRKGITAEMTVSEDHINRSGRINGGILMSFADVLGAIGTLANLPEGYRTTTLESKTNFFAAGEGEKLQAHTVPLHIGRTTMVWQTTVSNMDGTKVAIVTQTQIVIPKKT